MTLSCTLDALANRLKSLVSSYVPGQGDIRVVVGVWVGEQRCFFTFPCSETADGFQVNEETLFEIGSTTMAFTACLLADMVAKKQVQLDDPVKKFLPAEVGIPSHGGQEITLLDLANQSSGLPRLPSNFLGTVTDPANPCRDYGVDHLYAFLSSYKLRRAIGWRREHSNLGMGLLGHVLSLAAGQEYQEALAERICGPLGLRDTVVALKADQRTRLVQGHSATGELIGPWDMSALVGAGGVRSTARDLLAFLQTHLVRTGPLKEAAALCLTPTPRTGRTAPTIFRFGLASGLVALLFAALSQFTLVPGTGWFFGLFLLPPWLAGLYGGFGPGLFAALSQHVGAWLVYRDGFHLPLHALVSVVLAWMASSNHRERSRMDVLAWTRRKCGLWLSGETGGYASFVGLDTERGTAIVVLANCAEPIANLGVRLLDMLNEK
jgi:CubicO group peptidase (beta-lactamase class C family)